jgi:hypothetical protein
MSFFRQETEETEAVPQWTITMFAKLASQPGEICNSVTVAADTMEEAITRARNNFQSELPKGDIRVAEAKRFYRPWCG